MAVTLLSCTRQRIDSSSSVLKRVQMDLRSELLPFWAEKAVDREYGGFITHLDANGGRTGVSDKYLVTQARLVWVFSAAHRHGITDRGYLDIARQGVNFLLDQMWDEEFGGFFWCVRRNGEPIDMTKSTYGQSCAIYALAEYAAASGDARALECAARVFELLEQNARDGDLGYREKSLRNWQPIAGPEAYDKTFDTHVHLLEAYTALADVTRNPKHCDALGRLVRLLVEVRQDPAGVYRGGTLDRQWKPLPADVARTFYGLNVEFAWLLMDASRVLGEPPEKYRDIALKMIDHALEYGFDADRAGLALYGPMNGRVEAATNLPSNWMTKEWWPQAELLVALVEAYRWTGDRKYLDAFGKQFDWVWNRQIDHACGDWFTDISWKGDMVFHRNKGSERKCAYHNGRALMCIEKALKDLGLEDYRVGAPLVGRQ